MNVAGLVTVDVRSTLSPTQNVFDSASAKVGEVDSFDIATGWVTISSLNKQYFVPIKLITYIDPHELFLGATKEDLSATTPARPQGRRGLRAKGRAHGPSRRSRAATTADRWWSTGRR
ncbi:MAG: hypothetical protein JOZ75_11190 [Candidatus Dormibacteraeota bacterium]|nr:hypothetical protein [Candidatus Dormibacteraeota bacterium]